MLLVVLTAGGTWSAAAYAIGFFALPLAAVLRNRRAGRGLAASAAGLFALSVFVRCVGGDHGRDLRMRTGAREGGRYVDRIVDEQDLAVNAARVIRWTGFMGDPDVPALSGAMSDAYERMRAAQGTTPSPVLATYLGLQGADAYDDVEIGDVAGADGVVLFLHGFAGSFTLPCWEVSRAAAEAKLATVCPATRWVGDWWSPGGEAILRATVADLKRRGVTQIYLAGLSNGAVGATRLAPRFPGTFAGLIVISGASGDAPPPAMPVLAVQGRSDAQIPASIVRGYTTRAAGRYVELDAGHFALLLREEEATAAMAKWLTEQSRGRRRTRS